MQPVSPAIFVSCDGAPMLLGADTGLMLDAGNAARSGTRVQVLATGLGRVTPDWPAGLTAPLENPPAVAATVRVWPVARIATACACSWSPKTHKSKKGPEAGALVPQFCL